MTNNQKEALAAPVEAQLDRDQWRRRKARRAHISRRAQRVTK